jgi:hypothetical protein
MLITLSAILILAAAGLSQVWGHDASKSIPTVASIGTTQLSIHFSKGWTYLWPIVGPIAISDITGCNFSSVWVFNQGNWTTTTIINPSRFYAVLVANDCTAVITSVVMIPLTDLPLDQGWHLVSGVRSWSEIRGDCALLPGTSSGPLSLFYDVTSDVWQLPSIDQNTPMDGLRAYFVQLVGPCQLRAAESAGAQQTLLSASQLLQAMPPAPPCPPFCVSPPEPPSHLVVTAQSSSQIILTWQDNPSNELGIKLERRHQGGEFSALKSVDANVVAWVDLGLTPSMTYCYRASAFSALAESAFSDEACATTLSAVTSPPPTPPPPLPPPPTSTPDTIAQAIDRNHNNRIDDDEILYATSLWVNATPVPDLTGQPTINDAEIEKLIVMWVSQMPIVSSGLSHGRLTGRARSAGEAVFYASPSLGWGVFAAQGVSVQSLKVSIYSLSGAPVFHSDWVHNGLRWSLQNDRGERLANWAYLYVVTVKATDGRIITREARKLVLLR